MALTAGTRLGHYDVTALIGEGGMGQVWQATDTQLNRQVALKILPDAFADDPDRLARFTREAQILASLNHPNIAAIHGIEEAGGTRALVLELVEGPTLADRIAKGPIPLDEALPIAKQIAEALEAAHEQGVIHRDLKPANIKVKADGTVKVLDFGLAKALDPSPESDPSQSPTLTAAATQMGVIMGTAAYMSPEQARGKPVDQRADIWAYGAVLYEMLSGKRPFKGRDASETLAGVLRLEPDFDALPADTPARVSTVLRRCLEKEPKQRVHDMADVRLAMAGGFETTIDEVSEPVAPRLSVWQRPMGIATAVLSCLVVGGVVVWTLTRPAPPRVTRFRVPLATDQSFASPDRPVMVMSPDGATLVYAVNGSLWIRPLDQLEARRMSGTEGAVGPFFSPDSQWVGFWAGQELRRMALSGGAAITIAEVAGEPPDGVSWGADGAILYGHSTGILRVSAQGGSPEVVIPLEGSEAAHHPQLLPGGDLVLYTLRSGGAGSWGEAQMVVESLTGGERTVLLDGRDGRYVSTGHLVFALDNRILAVPFDPPDRAVRGGPVPLVEGVRQAGNTGGGAHFSLSATGSLAYVPGTEADVGYRLAWVNRAGDEALTAAPPRAYYSWAVSPDGTRIVTEIGDGNQRDLWLWRLDQGPLTRLTFDDGNDTNPLWTPDSTRVVFRSSRDGGGLFWKRADGTGDVVQLLEDGGVVDATGWSPDGRLLFSQDPGDIGLLSIDSDSTVEMLLETAFIERAARLSPDGRWMAYRSNESGEFQIFVRPFPNVGDGKWQVSTAGGRRPAWSLDGDELFFQGEPGQVMVAEVDTSDGFNAGTPVVAFRRPGAVFGGLGRGPVEERLLVGAARGVAGREVVDEMVVVQNWSEELLERVPVN